MGKDYSAVATTLQAQNDGSSVSPASEPVSVGTIESTASRLSARNSVLHRRSWIRTEPPPAVSLEPVTWMIFMDSLGLGGQISMQLSGAEHQVIEVRPGKSFARKGKSEYTIRPGLRADYDALLADVGKRVKAPSKIIHLWSVTSPASEPSADETLDLSFYSLLYLSQVVRDYDFVVDIAAVSNRLQCVSDEVPTRPLRATLAGATRGIAREFPGIVFRSIDCDPTEKGIGYTAVQIIAEHSAPFADPSVAYRADERWVESVAAAEPNGGARGSRLRDKGTYLITGGLGDLGLTIAESLASEFHARLILVDRSAVPPSDQWPQLLQTSDAPPSLRQCIMRLSELQSSGTEVRTISADLTNLEEMKKVIVEGCQGFGELNGVVHALSLANDQLFDTKTAESCRAVLDPLVQGALVLREALQGTFLDFFALCSRVSPMVPSPGKIEQLAASAFFDSFATSRPGLPVYAVEWLGGEKETGLNSSRYELGKAFARALAFEAPAVLTAAPDDLTAALKPNSGRAAEPAASPENIEAVLQGWWRTLLNFEEVGLNDDFFELGGHSLIGVTLFSKIKSTYSLNFGLSTLFEARTINQLAELIRRERQPVPKKGGAWSPVVPIQPKGTLAPLYVISGLGGNVVKFHRLASHLSENRPMYGLLPRGLDGEGPYHTRIEDIAADYVDAIQAAQPDGPYHLVGYSFGGIVAFEVAQQLLARGAKVGFLGLFDTIEVQYGEKIDAALSAGERLDVYSEHLKAIFSRDGAGYFTKLLAEKSSQAKRKLLDALGQPLPQTTSSIEEVNTYAATNYRARVYPGKLTLFRSTQRSVSDGTDEMLGWGGLAAGGVEVRSVPSNHFNMLREPAVKALAEELKSCLGGESPES